jgi:BioD-like phosphotransacetylase family protein
MPPLLIASLQPGDGRTTATAGLGAALAEAGRPARLLRLRAAESADPAAEDDARALAAVAGCTSPGRAVTEQEALSEAAQALCLIEGPPGVPNDLAARLSARVVLLTAATDVLRLGDLSAAATTLGDALAGVIATRQQPHRLDAAAAALRERGLTPLAVLPEDRLLAGPNVQELREALRASPLFEGADEGEAVEWVMLGPITADPGQPYFLQHGSKAIVNRFDKMDLHLAALATEPDCVVLTGGQQPSPYFLDRLRGSDAAVTVLLAPDGTVRTAELLDELYTRTRCSGRRKLQRAHELVRAHADLAAITSAIA